MCRVAILQLVATLVVACSCSSVDRSNAEGQRIRPLAAVINFSDHKGNASDPVDEVTTNFDEKDNASSPVAASINVSYERDNASGPINVNASQLFDVVQARELGEQITSSTQAVIWVKSLLPSTFSPTYICTGTVIRRDTVLASYTCVKKYSKGRLTVSEAQEILSDSYLFADVAHMNLNEGLDLAVLRLDKEEFFTQSSVSKMVDDSDTLKTGDMCTVSGWKFGKNEWQILNVSYLTSEDCVKAYSTVPYSPMNETMICANPEVGNSSCTQSVGWPLFCNGELAGLYSWTYFNCVQPGVYTSMKVSAPWISEATTTGIGSVVSNSSVTIAIVLMFYNLLLAFSR